MLWQLFLATLSTSWDKFCPNDQGTLVVAAHLTVAESGAKSFRTESFRRICVLLTFDCFLKDPGAPVSACRGHGFVEIAGYQGVLRQCARRGLQDPWTERPCRLPP